MSAYSEVDDAGLMRLVGAGNHDAFAELVGRHTQRFFNLAYRTLQNHCDAEDVVQQAFTRLWQNPHTWQADKSQFTTWFYRVVLNACHDLLRRRRDDHFDADAMEARLPTHISEQQRLDLRQDARMRQLLVEHAFAALSLKQRDALNLVVYCGLPQQQAADTMGIGLKALESLLSRARANLKQRVAELQAADVHLARSA